LNNGGLFATVGVLKATCVSGYALKRFLTHIQGVGNAEITSWQAF
jgi:hypothetical protein